MLFLVLSFLIVMLGGTLDGMGFVCLHTGVSRVWDGIVRGSLIRFR